MFKTIKTSEIKSLDNKGLCDNHVNLVTYCKDLKLPVVKMTMDELYEANSSFQKFGCTDYKDHRKDTKAVLKNLVFENNKNYTYQAISFVKNGNLAKALAVVGSRGNYTAALIF